MTTPVDPRPYAGPTDLVTAADAARWLRERADRDLRANCHPSAFVLHYAHADLNDRLDRERRQACRRGCFAMLHEARVFRAVERSWEYTARTTDNVNAEFLARTYRAKRRDYLSRALAFRAAARQP